MDGISVHILSRALREGGAISGFHFTLLYYIVNYFTNFQVIIFERFQYVVCTIHP